MKKKKKSVLKIVLEILIPLALIAALVIFVGIPLYATEEEDELDPPTVSYYEGDGETLVLESDGLRFEMDPKTTQFKVIDKKSGAEWLSNPVEAAQDPIALAANKAMLSSTLTLTYASQTGFLEINNYQYSIEDGTYSVEQTDDGISVHYAIGDIDKIFLIPTAITEERFLGFTDQMTKSHASRVKNLYTLYTPERLEKSEDKESVLAMYPSAAEQSIYVLKSDVKESNKRSAEEFFAEAGYSQEDYDSDLQLVAGAAASTKPVFNVTMNYRLEGDDLVVEIPYSDIRYRSTYPMTYLTVLPMFGAAGVQDEGYIFVPEGGGALIEYNNGKLSQNSYYANLYGWDYGSNRNEVVSETRVDFPVFGMIRKNGASFICMMEGATSYGAVQADISGRYNSYNSVSAKYNVLHNDRYNVSSARSSSAVYMYEKQIPNDTVIQRYRFIESDSYVDMANAYGSYLRDKYPSLTANDASEEMPVLVELVGAIDKKVVKLGLPMDSVVPTTTFDEADGIMYDLTGKKVKNLNLRYTGWSNGGVTQKVLTKVKPVKQIGGEKGMRALIESAKNKGVPLYFDGITTFAYNSGILDGFISFTNAARFTTREEVEIYPYSKIYYQQDDFYDPFYLVRPEYAKQNATNLIQKLADVNAAGVAFRDIGSILSADYYQRDTVTREQVKQQNIDTMLEAKDAGQKVIIKTGFDYALPYADLISDMDFKGQEYSILDQTVPFYQIAIHGAVDYTGLPINIHDDWQTELLRCAEYGAGLNFTFMAAEGEILQDTLHTEYYGANYDAWKDDAEQIIVSYQAAMAGLNRTPIVGHENLTSDVTVTAYQNGAKVYVNYGMKDYRAGSVTVPARSYLVTGGESK